MFNTDSAAWYPDWFAGIVGAQWPVVRDAVQIIDGVLKSIHYWAELTKPDSHAFNDLMQIANGGGKGCSNC